MLGASLGNLSDLVQTAVVETHARAYTPNLAPTLFGGWGLVREWDRIGSPGTLCIPAFDRLEESERALRRIEKKKRKRRYLWRRRQR